MKKLLLLLVLLPNMALAQKLYIDSANAGIVSKSGTALTLGSASTQGVKMSVNSVTEATLDAAALTLPTNNLILTAGSLTLGGDLAMATLRTLAIQEAVAGTACSGTLTANGAGEVTTATTCALTGSRIFLTRTSAETATVNAWVSTITNATSFGITSEAADTGTYNWLIIHEAP